MKSWEENNTICNSTSLNSILRRNSMSKVRESLDMTHILESKDRFINKNESLTQEQKDQIIVFFKKYPNYEKDVNKGNWNTKIPYSEFERVMAKASESKSSQKKAVRQGITGIREGSDYRFIGEGEMDGKPWVAYMPMSWLGAKTLAGPSVPPVQASKDSAGWCIGYSKTDSYWKNYTEKGDCFLIMCGQSIPTGKVAIEIMSTGKIIVWDYWDKSNADTGYSNGNGIVAWRDLPEETDGLIKKVWNFNKKDSEERAEKKRLAAEKKKQARQRAEEERRAAVAADITAQDLTDNEIRSYEYYYRIFSTYDIRRSIGPEGNGRLTFGYNNINGYRSNFCNSSTDSVEVKILRHILNHGTASKLDLISVIAPVTGEADGPDTRTLSPEVWYKTVIAACCHAHLIRFSRSDNRFHLGDTADILIKNTLNSEFDSIDIDIRDSIGRAGTGDMVFSAARYTFNMVTAESNTGKVLDYIIDKDTFTRREIAIATHVGKIYRPGGQVETQQAFYAALTDARIIIYDKHTRKYHKGPNADILIRDSVDPNYAAY